MMQLSPSTLAALVALIHNETGIALGPDKHYLLQHRLEPVLAAHKLATFDDLLVRLAARTTAGALRADVIDAIAIHETSFFRDPDVFAALAEHALAPALAQRARPIRIWSAAASTGQEPWSLAMILAEAMGGVSASWPSRASILATDISPHAVDVGRVGRYSLRDVERGISPGRATTYFRPSASTTVDRPTFDVCAALRPLVQFRTLNLIEPFTALGQFDVVLCRNVLIYFDDATKAKVVHSLVDAILPGGFLVLGAAESLYGIDAARAPGSAAVSSRLETLHFPRAVLYRRLPC